MAVPPFAPDTRSLAWHCVDAKLGIHTVGYGLCVLPPHKVGGGPSLSAPLYLSNPHPVLPCTTHLLPYTLLTQGVCFD